jgi:hypothetical protein
MVCCGNGWMALRTKATNPHDRCLAIQVWHLAGRGWEKGLPSVSSTALGCHKPLILLPREEPGALSLARFRFLPSSRRSRGIRQPHYRVISSIRHTAATGALNFLGKVSGGTLLATFAAIRSGVRAGAMELFCSGVLSGAEDPKAREHGGPVRRRAGGGSA